MRGLSIELGVGALIAGIIGLWNDAAAYGLLIFIGVLLIAYGTYEAFIKPRFRIERRLTDWLLRRGRGVRIERLPQFNFMLHLTSGSSEKEVFVTRDKETRDDLIAFTGKVSYLPTWFDILPTFSEREREALITDIRIYLTAKNLSVNFSQLPNGKIAWPPNVGIQTALPQDYSLSQHSVDLAAKTIELSVIGVRDLIRKAVAAHLAAADDDTESSQTLSPESTPDTEGEQNLRQQPEHNGEADEEKPEHEPE